MRCNNCEYFTHEYDGEESMAIESCNIFGAYNDKEVFENEKGMGCKYRKRTLKNIFDEQNKEWHDTIEAENKALEKLKG